MRIPRFFIDRPIFAGVLSILTTLVGAISLARLPVTQYPDVVPPTVVVSAAFPGATPEVLGETVAAPLEQEVNGVEGMLYMESQSSPGGGYQLTITFELGTDLDTAVVRVQNRIAVAEPRLPEVTRRIGLTTRKQSPDLLMVVHLVSPGGVLDQSFISNYAILQVRDELARLPGVGNASVVGSRRYSMRVWLDADRLEALDLGSADVVRAIAAQNLEVAAGAIGAAPLRDPPDLRLPIDALGRLETEEQFRGIVVRAGENGRLVRLGDIARVELGAESYASNAYLDGEPAVALLINQRPGSNALRTAAAVKDAMAELLEVFPPGLEHRIVYNPTEFVSQSIRAVVRTLFQALGLVVLVVFVFLKTWRATLIPAAAIPVSLVGTFAVMQGLGFSINNLSLFGLVLAIGIVVDDAIVVVENVERNLSEGRSPKEAARVAMDEVASALIATTLVLVAVFVPTAFLSGVAGRFYQQFALTISVSTVFSTAVSLTLSPALAALLLRGEEQKRGALSRVYRALTGWFFAGFDRLLGKATDAYVGVIGRVLRLSAVALACYAGLLGLTAWGFNAAPTGFIPVQDQGYLIVAIQLPDGASLARTDEVTRRVGRLAEEVEGIDAVVAIAGFSGVTRTNKTNAAVIFTPLEPFEDRVGRGLGAFRILAALRDTLAPVRDAQINIIPPPPVRGLGTGGGFRMIVQDRGARGFDTLARSLEELRAAAAQEPGFTQVFTNFRAETPRVFVDIDREKARMLGVPVDDALSTLQAYFGSFFVNEFNLFGRTFRVTVQGDDAFRDEPEDVLRLTVPNRDGAAVPLASIAEATPTTGPDRVVRYNLFPSAALNGQTLPTLSTGRALDTMERLAGEILPRGIDYAWTDTAYQQRQAGNTALYIFPLVVVFAFLALAAQYESWLLPLAVILIVPLCLLFGLGAVTLRGMPSNLMVQIGLVVLAGLACKNAILIVEFARQKRAQGMDRSEATREACRERLRPILMTSFSFILGVLPLVLASGPGAELRRALGTTVFGGMIGVTFVGLLLTPVFYDVLARFREPSPAEAPGTPD